MAAGLFDAALVHDDDLVCVLDGGKSVGYHNGGTALHELFQSLGDQAFGFCIIIWDILLGKTYPQVVPKPVNTAFSASLQVPFMV